MTILSVDWDFFVPTDFLWDLGHREAEFFLNGIWLTRGYLIPKMKSSGFEDQFWGWVQKHWSLRESVVHVSESHLDVHSLLYGHAVLILVDAHHDCWSPQKVKDGWQIDCATWATAWLRKHPIHRMLWIRPDWQAAKDSIQSRIAKDIRSQVTVVAQSKIDRVDLKHWLHREVTDVHICRSGCWAPPWLDDKFITLVKSYPRLVEIIKTEQNHSWDPMSPRWGKEEIKQAEQLQENLNKMRDPGGIAAVLSEVSS